jgi:UDP-N-acetyl-2-amino-2-deoxyglucuronate dehydrogenase
MNFALTGLAGYVAERHLRAIRDTGNNLVTAFDPHDSVGIVDRYFPDCRFFSVFERFDRHLEKLKRNGEPVEYLSICAPNYLHDAHVRSAFRVGANAICEKPLVISPWNLDQLAELELECNRKVYCVLQLRHHKNVLALKEKVDSSTKSDYEINLRYVTPRGRWYNTSWKGDAKKSGGVAMNIGIHFFDMLMWIFGDVNYVEFGYLSENTIRGRLELDKANVNWFLSTEAQYSKSGQADRSLSIDGEEFDFSVGFEDLHTTTYSNILAGSGYGIEDARRSVELTFRFREPAIVLQREANCIRSQGTKACTRQVDGRSRQVAN